LTDLLFLLWKEKKGGKLTRFVRKKSKAEKKRGGGVKKRPLKQIHCFNINK